MTSTNLTTYNSRKAEAWGEAEAERVFREDTPAALEYFRLGHFPPWDEGALTAHLGFKGGARPAKWILEVGTLAATDRYRILAWDLSDRSQEEKEAAT